MIMEINILWGGQGRIAKVRARSSEAAVCHQDILDAAKIPSSLLQP